MSNRIPPYVPQFEGPSPIFSAPMSRPPLSDEPAYKTLAPHIGISDVHAISTGQLSLKYVHWRDHNTVDLGNVIEDVQDITLSGHHTFADRVLDAAIEQQRLNPGCNLYLGIPPKNPQKYVLVVDDVLSRNSKYAGIVIPLDRRPHRDGSQPNIVKRGSRSQRPAPASSTKFLNRLTRRGVGSNSHVPNNPTALSGGGTGRTPGERAAELNTLGVEFQQRLHAVDVRHGSQPGKQLETAKKGTQTQRASSPKRPHVSRPEVAGSASLFHAGASTESNQSSARVRDAGKTPMPRRSKLPETSGTSSELESSSTETSVTARNPIAGSPSARSWLPGSVSRIPRSPTHDVMEAIEHNKMPSAAQSSDTYREIPHLSGFTPSSSGNRRGGAFKPLTASSSDTYREIPHLSGFTPSSSGNQRDGASEQLTASSSPTYRTSQESADVGSSRSPSPLSHPVNWQEVRKILEESRRNRHGDPARERVRNAMRKELGLLPRSAAPALPEAIESSSLPPYHDELPVLLSINDKNKYGVATRALQSAVGTRPGLRNEIQQRGWAGLLNHTLQAYDNVLNALQSGKPEEAHAWEVEMRNSLRELLSLSDATNVFNFSVHARPVSDSDLDAFVSLPQFRMLVQAVNEVHQRLENQRPRRGDSVGFVNSPRDTYDDLSQP